MNRPLHQTLPRNPILARLPAILGSVHSSGHLFVEKN
jgi:hypothetical protein